MLHLQVYFERYCRKCRKYARQLVVDYGTINSLEEADQKLGNHNLPVMPIKCPQCGSEDWPEYALFHDARKNFTFQRVRIGTEEMPVVGGGAGYAYTRTPEEQAELDRGLAKLETYFKQEEERFWQEYTNWAFDRWQEALKWLNEMEWKIAYKKLGISDIIANPSPTGFRKDAEKRFKSDEEKARLWREANSHLVYFELLWVPIDTWPVEEYVRLYGRERVTWLILNLPLPEELEKYRTEKLAVVIPSKTSGPQSVLWERIKQLGDELTRQRRRAENLARQLAEERAEKARLNEEIHMLRNQIEYLKGSIQSPVRSVDDMLRIKRLKALIKELREENELLRRKLEELNVKETTVGQDDQAEENISDVVLGEAETNISDISEQVKDKKIVVYGRVEETFDKGPVMVFHEGDKWDVEAQRLANESDVLVILTRMCSHEVMWAAKEYAADTGKPIVFSRASGVEGIMRGVCKILTIKEE